MAQTRCHMQGVASRRFPTWQMRQPRIAHGAAKVFTQAVVTLPLGFIKRLVGRGFMRKVGVFLGVGQHIHVELVVQIRLHNQKGALGSHAGARAAIDKWLTRPLAVPYARQQHTSAAVVVLHVLGREHGEVACLGPQQLGGFFGGVEIYLGTKVDAGFAHQVFQVTKLIADIATCIRQDDEVEFAFEQGVYTRVLKMTPIRQIPPGPFDSKKSRRRFAGQHQWFGHAAPAESAEPLEGGCADRRPKPLAQANTEKIYEQGQTTRGVRARTG